MPRTKVSSRGFFTVISARTTRNSMPGMDDGWLPEDNFTHFDASGNARMVDIGGKGETDRIAVAAGRVIMAPETCRMVREGTDRKGRCHSVWHG